MIQTVLQIIVAILIVGVLVWAIEMLPAIDATFKQVAKVILIAILVIYAIITLSSFLGFHLLAK